ncbi:MAG: addiction module protein [Campylobacterales bacterium]
MKALNFLVDNNIKEFQNDNENLELTAAQKKELDSRISSFHKNPSISRSWDEIKSEILK